MCSGSVSVSLELLCRGTYWSVCLLFCSFLLRSVAFRLFYWLMCWLCSCWVLLLFTLPVKLLRGRVMCEYSLYFVIHLYLVILVGIFCCVYSDLPQYPGVFSGARTCYRLAVNQGVRVLSLTTVQKVRFAGLAILRAHND